MDIFGIPEQVPFEFNHCIFNPEFSQLDLLKAIVKSHESVLFQPFDKEGLRVSPLKLKVRPSASFRMQPCRFIWDGILKPLKTMFDHFNKKDGGIRIAVDYREVNMQLQATANQSPLAYFISMIGGQRFYAKVDNLWGYH